MQECAGYCLKDSDTDIIALLQSNIVARAGSKLWLQQCSKIGRSKPMASVNRGVLNLDKFRSIQKTT